MSVPEDVGLAGVTVLARDMVFSTPYGDTGEWKLIEYDGALTADGAPRRALVVWSHGWPLDRIDHEAHRRVFWVLQQAGVRKVLCSSTAGALNRAVLKGDLTIANDILELTQTRSSLLPGRVAYDCSGRQMVCPACAATLAETARELWPAGGRVYGREAGLVAAHAWGPRLTTPAEAHAYRTLGADFVNHSLAPEATMAREIGVCFVNCTFITVDYDDYFAPADRPMIGEGPAVRPRADRLARRPAGRRPFPAGRALPVRRPAKPAGPEPPRPALSRGRWEGKGHRSQRERSRSLISEPGRRRAGR